MRGPSQLKRDFLKKWAKGLQICESSKKEMNLFERKKAIKLSADVAMAMATSTNNNWSVALISDAAKDDNNIVLIEQMLGSNECKKLSKASIQSCSNFRRTKKSCSNFSRSKKILKKSCSNFRRTKKMAATRIVLASCIAKNMVKKRTQVLKNLVPGGQSMDECSLIKETLDYIVSLRAQVDVMRRLADVAEHLNRSKVVNN